MQAFLTPPLVVVVFLLTRVQEITNSNNTGAATIVPASATAKPVRSPLKAQGRPNGCLGPFKGGTQGVQTSPWTPWSP